MEFEKAVYRIYEKTVESFVEPNRSDRVTRTCRVGEFVLLTVAIFYLWELLYIHSVFVGSSGCLPAILSQVASSRNQTVFAMHSDELLELNLDNELRRLREPMFDTTDWSSDETAASSVMKFIRMFMVPRSRRNLMYKAIERVELNQSTRSSPLSSNYTDFQFATTVGVLVLPGQMRKAHKFNIINATLATDACFGSELMRLALPSDGIDVIVLNLVTFTLHEDGILKSYPGNVYRDIDTRVVKPFHNFLSWMLNRLNVLVKSVFCFVFVSTSTALMIRVLVASGVILIFPIFWIFTFFGADNILLHPRIIALSYPWIGVPMEVIRDSGTSPYPFIIAHFTRLVLYYFMFQAIQLLTSMIFYRDDVPGLIDVWLFAVIMMAEYYSMVYVRSVKSTQVFPRVTLVFFLIYHFYMYLHPTGFHLLALWVFFLFELVLMVFCFVWFEIPAHERGEITIDAPRALHNSLPWPTWPVALAPDYTIFLPVTHRAIDVYGAPTGTVASNNGPNAPNAANNNGPPTGNNNQTGIAPNSAIGTGFVTRTTTTSALHAERASIDGDVELGNTIDDNDRGGLMPIAINSGPLSSGLVARAASSSNIGTQYVRIIECEGDDESLERPPRLR